MEPEDHVLRAAEAVLTRRKQSRKRKEDMAKGVVNESSSVTVKWFKTMLSMPPKKTLTTLQTFAASSAFLAYFLNGLFAVAFPQFINRAFFCQKLSGRDLEYMRLDFCLLALVGFLNVVAARSRPLIAGNGSILGTVPERLLFDNVVLMWNLQNSLIPLSVVSVFTLLNVSSSLITFIIWYHETPGASPRKFLEAITKLMRPVLNPVQNWSSRCLQFIGYFNIVLSVTLLAKPAIVRDALGLDQFAEFSEGLLSLYFMNTAVIGWLHVLSGGDGNDSSPIAAVFYRLAWSVPLVSAMCYFGRIERTFAITISISEALSALLILACLFIDALSTEKRRF